MWGSYVGVALRKHFDWRTCMRSYDRLHPGVHSHYIQACTFQHVFWFAYGATEAHISTRADGVDMAELVGDNGQS